LKAFASQFPRCTQLLTVGAFHCLQQERLKQWTNFVTALIPWHVFFNFRTVIVFQLIISKQKQLNRCLALKTIRSQRLKLRHKQE